MRYYKVSVQAGDSHDDLAVLAPSEDAAIALALSAGYHPTSAGVYAIDDYGRRFCALTLGEVRA